MTRVVFACVHNAGRSQMAAAWFNQIADAAKARAISAGTQPLDHQGIESVRAIRDEVESGVRTFVAENLWARVR